MNQSPLPRRAFIVALATIGMLLSLSLEYVHYRAYTAPGASSFCAVGERLDCASVALSKYSVVFGVPLPVWGFAGFLAIALAAIRGSRWLLPLTALAALASLVLLGVSALSIGAFCLFCEGVHLVSLGLFALAFLARRAALAPLIEVDSVLFTFAPPLGIVLAAALFVSPYWGSFGWKGELPYAQGLTESGEHWIGAAAPKLNIEEFVDYSCPHCRVASARHLRALGQHTDELRIIRRYYPRLSCTPAPEDNRCYAIRIAHCAGEQGKFWQADRWLFERFDLNNEYDLNEAARELALDRARLGECVEAETTYAWAVNVWRTAKKLRVPGTPYYRVDGHLMAQPKVDALIESL